jgi:hypothetical protein
MIEYFGNCSGIINWNEVVDSLKDQEPAYIGPRHKATDNIEGIDEVAILWERLGYKTIHDGGVAGWDMFLPGINFDRSIVKKFIKWTGVTNNGPEYAWISRINPGKMAPWHWDVTDDEATLSKESVRFHCHIIPQSPGHSFFVGDSCFYNQQIGDVFKWNNRKLWHAGSNCGITPKYIFNFWI